MSIPQHFTNVDKQLQLTKHRTSGTYSFVPKSRKNPSRGRFEPSTQKLFKPRSSVLLNCYKQRIDIFSEHDWGRKSVHEINLMLKINSLNDRTCVSVANGIPEGREIPRFWHRYPRVYREAPCNWTLHSLRVSNSRSCHTAAPRVVNSTKKSWKVSPDGPCENVWVSHYL